jgi:serpin B
MRRSTHRPAGSRIAVAIILGAMIVTACGPAAPSPTVSAVPTPSASVTPSRAPSPSPSASAQALAIAMSEVARDPAGIADAQAAAAAINAFGFDLYRALAATGDNVVLSPASVAIALGMARTGARGLTATEMDAVLHDVASDDHPGWLNGLDQALASRTTTFTDDEGTPHDQTLELANAYFAQRGFDFEGAYLDALAARFGAGVHTVDYEQDAEAARSLINEWANERTRGRIPAVLQPGDVTAETRLALVNAIYLKASWARQFQEDQTVSAPFMRPDGSTVSVPMMRVRQAACAQGDGSAAADIAYLGGQLSMLLIVPDDLASFEAELDGDLIATIDEAAAATYAQADVTMPRFDIETRQELSDILGALGMPTALDAERADFSGMTTAERLFIGKVIHQANISVDEKGTEAAAVTVVGMDTTGGGPSETCTAHADRPFLFAVRDVETGTVLFMGRVVDPSEE